MGAPVGNQNGKKAREWELALKRAMARRAHGDFRETLNKLADVVIDQALSGDRNAWMEIGNRMDGKPVTPVEGADGGPVVAVFRWATEETNQ